MMLKRIEVELFFNKIRDYKLVTPCCHKNNKDGKFVNYKGYPKYYGYCHSCGKASVPPSVYEDDNGSQFTWDDTLREFKSLTGNSNLFRGSDKNSFKSVTSNTVLNNDVEMYYKSERKCNTIPIKTVAHSLQAKENNNLIAYLIELYGYHKVSQVIKMYYIGTSKFNWTIFWYVDKQGRVRKSKEVLYKSNGKRTNKFRVPYKNENDYYFCLYGEHLLERNTKPIILVESEKTAIVCAIQFPQYTWLAYSGINGLTNNKLLALKNLQIVIIPDMSRNAVNIIKSKELVFNKMDIDYKILDLTEGKSDEYLKANNLYNADLEDIISSCY